MKNITLLTKIRRSRRASVPAIFDIICNITSNTCNYASTVLVYSLVRMRSGHTSIKSSEIIINEASSRRLVAKFYVIRFKLKQVETTFKGRERNCSACTISYCVPPKAHRKYAPLDFTKAKERPKCPSVDASSWTILRA